MPTMTRSALAPALSRFTDEQPNVVIRVVEAYSAVLTQQVRAGDLDFAVVPAIPSTPGILEPPLLANDRAARLPTRIAPPPPRPGAAEYLGSLRLVVPGPQNTRRRSIETYLAANGLQCERVLELDAMLGTLDFVSRSDWVTILPGIMMAADIERPLVTINPIVDPVFTLDLVLIEPSRRAMSPAARSFLKCCRWNQRGWRNPGPLSGAQGGQAADAGRSAGLKAKLVALSRCGARKESGLRISRRA